MRKLPLIMIDPGHGGTDPGATPESPIEAGINLAVALHLRDILENQGFAVIVTRLVDRTLSLDERVMLEHQFDSDLFISLHCNAAADPRAKGIEIWTAPGDSPADPAATEIFRAVSKAFPDRRLRTDYTDSDLDKEARFRVLTGTLGPAVLLEMGFVSNAEERAWLQSTATQVHMALAIAAGILAWHRTLKDQAHARIDDIRKSHPGAAC
ncbi:N-acetylmuramoyl-L-alanine amidase [Desulfuromonas soudanensis]|uniref:N-acetylmuramoyl-L-alanine amidase n=1 Tax=Desulfuromonas soudanensis TaxID=1603606 RepID=A0A0M4CYY5_9BACT|nr:N-acetylmuramoyl-L-alanine amidase [Desulfuromonas soudanensis]ALC15640.1 N-acetylmuramoyl-L-alanine amidase [Desulfuromonas soudanensis]